MENPAKTSQEFDVHKRIQIRTYIYTTFFSMYGHVKR